MTRVIAICSQKGGVGKTTTAVNLSAFLHEGGRRTLLVDLDPQANATSGLDGKRPDAHPLRVLLQNPQAWEDVSAYTTLRNVFLVPSTCEDDVTDVLGQATPERIAELRHSLVRQSPPYHYVILDTPPAFGPVLSVALELADSVLIPVQCEYFAIEGLAQVLEVIEKVGENRGRALEIEGLLLTMFSEELEISYDVAREVEKHFPDRILRTIIPRDVKLAECASHGVPISTYDPRSRGSWAYLNLAKEIMTHVSEQKAGPRSGLFDTPERRVGAKRRSS